MIIQRQTLPYGANVWLSPARTDAWRQNDCRPTSPSLHAAILNVCQICRLQTGGGHVTITMAPAAAWLL